jgi:predicted permease
MRILGDVRLSLRVLAKHPGFTAAAVAMLALGIGIDAAVFTVTDAVLFKGFPLVERNDRLLYISNGGCCISYPDFADIRAQSKSFSGMGITHGIADVVSDANGFAERIEVTEVSADTFRTVGRRPVLGRDFAAADEQVGAAPVAILNHRLWQRRCAGDRSIVGKTVRLHGIATTVIGVMPAGFSFPQTVDLWVPLVPTAEVLRRDHTDTWFAFGRLRDGVSFASARAEVEGIIQRLETVYPLTDQRFHLVVQNFAGFFIGANATALYGSMWAAVGFVLLIACANLANLQLARAMGKSREISVRIALGAGRWQIMRQLLVESVLLSGLGGVLGWWIARWSVRSYELAMAAKSSWLILDYTMDGRVLAYLIAISVGTGILFGLAPALRLAKLDVNTGLKDEARGVSGGGAGRHLSSLLVTGELALAIVLLAGAGVLIRSFLKIHNAAMGVNADHLLVATMALPDTRYRPEQQSKFYEGVRMRLEAVPGVESVAMAGSLPSWNVPKYPYELAGASESASPEQTRRPKLAALYVSPGYFHTVGAAVLAGREFVESDGVTGPPVALVNQFLARRFWPGEDPTGKRLRFFTGDTPEPWMTVVGVVSNIIQDDITRQKMEPVAYLPYGRSPGARWFLARTQVAPGGLGPALRREVQALDPDLPVYGPFILADRLERYWDSRFYGALFLVFAAMALLLASFGLYTVVAHAVSRRTQEIGIRMAVGATGRDILRLVFRQGMMPLAVGLGIGLAASFAVNQVLKTVLVGVSPSDPLALAVASGVLALAAALGCWIPALRAMRVDPAMALRHE